MRPRPARSTAKAEALGHEAKATGLAALWGAIRLAIEPSHARDGRLTLTHASCPNEPPAFRGADGWYAVQRAMV